MQYKSVHEAGEGRRERRKDSSFLGQITAPSQKPSLSQFRQLTNTSSFAVSQLRFPRKKKKKKKNQIYRASVVSFSIDEVMRIFFPTSKTSKNQWKKRLRSSGGGGGRKCCCGRRHRLIRGVAWSDLAAARSARLALSSGLPGRRSPADPTAAAAAAAGEGG